MEQSAIRVLIVEDDTQIRNFMQYSLQREAYQVTAVGTGKKGMEILEEKKADILLLDLGLPDMEGINLLRWMREKTNLPVIVISARNQDAEKVEALDAGADDYLTKPFSVSELLARLRVSVRHIKILQEDKAGEKNEFRLGGLCIDYEKHMVFLEETYVHLTPMEYNLLVLLAQNAGKIMTTGTLIRRLWGENYGEDTRSLRTLMASLRRKIERIPAKPVYIVTEVGVGYRMVTSCADR